MLSNDLKRYPSLTKRYRGTAIRYSQKILFWLIVSILFCSSAALCAERLTVAVSVANVRSGPGKNYDLLWKAEKYYPFTVKEKIKGWHKVRDYEGYEGWVWGKLLEKIPAVITKKDKCNIRSGPGTKNDVLFSAERGVPFKVLKRKGQWIRIRHSDGDEGWIHSSLVW